MKTPLPFDMQPLTVDTLSRRTFLCGLGVLEWRQQLAAHF